MLENYLGASGFVFFQEKTNVCIHTQTPTALPAQKTEKADLQSSLVERVSLRIKLESQDYLLEIFWFGPTVQQSNPLNGL